MPPARERPQMTCGVIANTLSVEGFMVEGYRSKGLCGQIFFLVNHTKENPRIDNMSFLTYPPEDGEVRQTAGVVGG